jgi:protein-disulfide isomerase
MIKPTTKSKIAPLTALFLAILTPAGAQSAPAKNQPAAPAPAAAPDVKPMLLPSPAQVEAALKRTLGYDPSLSWQVVDVRPSSIPGLVELFISINKQQPVRIYWSLEEQAAIVGELIPFGPNPFEPARQKLRAADGPSRGATNAAILIVDFSDLECPHCKAAQPVLEKLAAEFPQVRLVFQQFPLPESLHPWAMKAALYADCAARTEPAGKEAFWKYVDAIFENQGAIAAPIADDKLKELANGAGLNAQKVADCSTALETQARVKKSMELGQALDVNETPTVFINGRRVKSVASIPYEQLKAMVQFEIDHAGK